MGKHKKRQQRSYSNLPVGPNTLDSARVLRYAALGKTKKLRGCLKSDVAGELLNAAVDSSGARPLHQACRHGHLDAAALLLRRGADVNVQDAAGNTPGHLAAMHGHVLLLAELIKRAEKPVDLDLLNNTGLSIRDILQLKQQQDPCELNTDSEGGSPQSGSGTDDSSDRLRNREPTQAPGAMPVAAAADAEWRARLAEEWSDGEGGWGNDMSGAWAGEAPQAGDVPGDARTAAEGAAADAGDDADDVWADRLWKDMQDHRRSCAQEAAAARAATVKLRQGFVGDRDAAAQERRSRAAAAAAESERILREEQSKDDDWRAAMMRQIEEAALPSQRATYEQKWAALDAWPASRPITFRDMPWPAATASTAGVHRTAGPQQQPELQIDLVNLRTLVFGGASGPAALKVALRRELMRWHPDKFGARFGSRLAGNDRDSILAGVQAVAQQLTALKTV